MKKLFVITFLIFSNLCFASSNNTTGSFWSTINVSSHLGDRKFPYYFAIQPRFFDRSDFFDLLEIEMAIGVRSTEKTSFWLGYVFVPDKIFNTGRYDLQNRVWQQFSWYRQLHSNYYLTWRSRLEQRFIVCNPGVAWRYRQKASLILFESDTKNTSLTLSDEIHININHPEWIPNKFVNQNRLSIAGSFNTSKNSIAQLGYLLQWKFRDPRDQVVHILFMTFKIKLD